MEQLLGVIKDKVDEQVFNLIEAIILGELPEEQLILLADEIKEKGSDFLELSNGDLLFKKDIRRLSYDYILSRTNSTKKVGTIFVNMGCSDKQNFANTKIELLGSHADSKLEFESIKKQLL
jgi:hypothetical protein